MRILSLAIIILFTVNLCAQKKTESNPIAVKSIDGIVNEVLEIISGEEGKIRDWDGFRNLFLPTANFTVLYHDDTFHQSSETINLEEFIHLMHDEYYNKGFTEYEISKVVDEYNGIANVFQSYYGKDSEGYEEKGITSYQLIYFENRWWIANILWTGDSNGVEIPKKYLGKN